MVMFCARRLNSGIPNTSFEHATIDALTEIDLPCHISLSGRNFTSLNQPFELGPMECAHHADYKHFGSDLLFTAL